MNIDLSYTLKLIERDCFATYRGQPISEVEWDAEYDVEFHLDTHDDCTNLSNRLEISEYHVDMEKVDSEDLQAVEEGLVTWLNEETYQDHIKVKDGMTLLVEFSNDKQGKLEYRVITEEKS